MRHPSLAPTMKDVAREAGVSLGTVSKVINGIPVGESYRRRVEEAIEKLGYRVNYFARSLKTSKTRCIALIMPSLRHPFFALLTDEITACLMRHDYRALLMITDFDPEAERKCFELVRENMADGVIALTYSPELEPEEELPVVSIDRHFSERIPCVSSDNYGGGELAAETLTALGCRKLLFFRIGPDVPGEADKRGAGFLDRCRALGAAVTPMILNDRETEAPFFEYLDAHMPDGAPDYDGIFCNTDSLAIHIVNHLRSRGVDVPGSVQVIGYDGIRNYSTGQCFCSTIEQPLAAMAETAVEILIHPDNFTAGARVSLPVRYIPGGTTKDSETA